MRRQARQNEKVVRSESGVNRPTRHDELAREWRSGGEHDGVCDDVAEARVSNEVGHDFAESAAVERGARRW